MQAQTSGILRLRRKIPLLLWREGFETVWFESFIWNRLREIGFESVRTDILYASKHRLFFSMNTIRGRVLAGGVAAAMSIPTNFYE